MIEALGSNALTWPSVRPAEVSVWHGHVAFAHWLVEALRPRLVVELGTHNGVSYFSFCNAIERLGLDARAVAVDTWEGDHQAGLYDESVYERVRRFNGQFSDFSTLKRNYFDDVVESFEDGSIDLLHIDGLHTYEAVRHDYETWRAKLSPRAIVLFHDTRAFIEGYGVHTFWDELMREGKGFNFHHSAGLGVLLHGTDVPAGVEALCSVPDQSAEATRIRQSFELFSRIAQTLGQEAVVQALAHPGENIALHCRASQSSYYSTNAETPQGAVNGIRTGHFGFHTDNEARPWWRLDLGGRRTFDEIRIFNRLDPDCAVRSRTIEISISDDGLIWDTVYSHDGSVFGGIDGHPLSFVRGGMEARYILLRLREANFFHLDEVEVYRH
ncbi:hypothetical protein GCM10007886_18940 [Methylobacterium gregans]|uniref:F5/8 type C domain-containing protein n=2 Tax=Methylobacterium gregans TaxID=374424 RepID=A0AA37HLN2_9HYPH|nr:hypothetical protein NBEOAGPD_0888 [Methylobacterium gregans]GLS53711.1 hypothetical protein GCM10007886_18940 [Methylobacterium gregans]